MCLRLDWVNTRLNNCIISIEKFAKHLSQNSCSSMPQIWYFAVISRAQFKINIYFRKLSAIVWRININWRRRKTQFVLGKHSTKMWKQNRPHCIITNVIKKACGEYFSPWKWKLPGSRSKNIKPRSSSWQSFNIPSRKVGNANPRCLSVLDGRYLEYSRIWVGVVGVYEQRTYTNPMTYLFFPWVQRVNR